MSLWGVVPVVLMTAWAASIFVPNDTPYRGLYYGCSVVPFLCFLLLTLMFFGAISSGEMGTRDRVIVPDTRVR